MKLQTAWIALGVDLEVKPRRIQPLKKPQLTKLDISSAATKFIPTLDNQASHSETIVLYLSFLSSAGMRRRRRRSCMEEYRLSPATDRKSSEKLQFLSELSLLYSGGRSLEEGGGSEYSKFLKASRSQL